MHTATRGFKTNPFNVKPTYRSLEFGVYVADSRSKTYPMTSKTLLILCHLEGFRRIEKAKQNSTHTLKQAFKLLVYEEAP